MVARQLTADEHLAVPTEAEIEALIATVDAEIVDALEARSLARTRLLLQIGLTEAAHPDAARFDRSEANYDSAVQRVTDLELKRAGLNAACCYTASNLLHARLEEIQRRADVAASAVAGFEDIRIELNRRELSRLRAGGANLILNSIPPPPSAAYLEAFQQRRAEFDELVKKLQAIQTEGAAVSERLNHLEKKYGAAVVHALTAC
jgi:hypothetical protein